MAVEREHTYAFYSHDDIKMDDGQKDKDSHVLLLYLAVISNVALVIAIPLPRSHSPTHSLSLLPLDRTLLRHLIYLFLVRILVQAKSTSHRVAQ